MASIHEIKKNDKKSRDTVPLKNFPEFTVSLSSPRWPAYTYSSVRSDIQGIYSVWSPFTSSLQRSTYYKLIPFMLLLTYLSQISSLWCAVLQSDLIHVVQVDLFHRLQQLCRAATFFGRSLEVRSSGADSGQVRSAPAPCIKVRLRLDRLLTQKLDIFKSEKVNCL